MTMYQIDAYLSQIQYVSPLIRIRYYLRDIKNAFFGMFSDGYEPDPEYDEDENEQTRLVDQCEGAGLIPPEKQDAAMEMERR